MRILLVCDGRSPIAINWIAYLIENGHEIHVASTFEFNSNLVFASINTVPVAFSQLKRRENQSVEFGTAEGLVWNSELVKIRTAVRRIAAPFTINSAGKKLSKIITEIQPDLVHAMRIPFEGIVAAKALENLEQPPL